MDHGLRISLLFLQSISERLQSAQTFVGIKMNVTEDRRFKKKQRAPSCTAGSSSLSWAGRTCCYGISALAAAAALSRSLKIKLDTKNHGSLPNPSECGEAECGMTTLQTFEDIVIALRCLSHLPLLLFKITSLPFFWILFGIEIQNNPVLNMF